MRISDFIVEFLIEKEITDVFGYPGGMVTYLMDSFSKYSSKIKSHLSYHEQAAAFSACGYAQVSKKPGFAFATSGPGATNLITGIANAYFDSIPCIFVTGQVNTYEQKKDLKVRQKGFQETDLVNMMQDITKYVVKIENPEDIKYELEKAYFLSMNGRPGPVVLDIPMNIQRSEVEIDTLKSYDPEIEIDQNVKEDALDKISKDILSKFKKSERPVIIAGAGVSNSGMRREFRRLADLLQIPIVTSMIGVDAINTNSDYSMGFVGAYGHRCANFIVAKSDLIISMGSRLDVRQTGADKSKFAENATLLRIDIDPDEMTNRVKESEIQYTCDLKFLIPNLISTIEKNEDSIDLKTEWLDICNEIKVLLNGVDHQVSNLLIEELSRLIPDEATITTDVGQNQVWVAQSFEIKDKQRVLFSGGHGAMGYSLPASIGAYFASQNRVYSISGDGGFQMNLQELQFIKRENLPIKIIIINNRALGMIRHFQEMYFDSNDVQTVEGNGYSTVEFNKLALAYDIPYHRIEANTSIKSLEAFLIDNKTRIFEIVLNEPTYVFPKLSMGHSFYDQEPLLKPEMIEKIMKM